MKVQKHVDFVERALDRALSKSIAVLKKKVALPIINRFQKRVKFKVVLLYCNGDFWLDHKDNPFVAELNGALDKLGLERCYPYEFKPANRHRMDWAVANRFPELIDLWELCYKLDALPGRPMFGRMFGRIASTVKPRKTK